MEKKGGEDENDMKGAISKLGEGGKGHGLEEGRESMTFFFFF